MTAAAAEAAARFAARPGFDLVSFREVGIPIYRMTLLTVVMIERPLPALQEFALRAIDAGFDTPAGVAEFLGLDERDLDEAFYVLVAEHFIEIKRLGEGGEGLVLTPRGKDALESFRMTQAEERSYVVDYDGLLRIPVRQRGWSIRERALRDTGAIALAPSPPRRPNIRDLDIAQVEGALREMRAIDRSRKLLELVRVARTETVFLPATMLVFRAHVGDEVHAAFVIDGRLSEDHAQSFAEAQGPARLGLLTGNADSLREAASEVLGSAAAEAALEALRHDTRPPPEVSETADQDPGPSQTIELLETFDHPRYLNAALASAKSRLVIVSPWIKRRVVDEAFVGRLRSLLRQDVHVYIGFGISLVQAGSDDGDAVRALERLASEFPHFVLRRFGDTHAKVLIVDDDLAVVTSFNWLSFVGDPDRTFRDERGMLVRRPHVVADVAKRILSRFEAA
jgi:hypothetical protein